MFEHSLFIVPARCGQIQSKHADYLSYCCVFVFLFKPLNSLTLVLCARYLQTVLWAVRRGKISKILLQFIKACSYTYKTCLPRVHYTRLCLQGEYWLTSIINKEIKNIMRVFTLFSIFSITFFSSIGGFTGEQFYLIKHLTDYQIQDLDRFWSAFCMLCDWQLKLWHWCQEGCLGLLLLSATAP